MNLLNSAAVAALTLATGLAVWPVDAVARAEHHEFPFEVMDWNDCTQEDVVWDAVIYETLMVNESNGGRAVVMDHWRWEATVEGLSTGFVWSTKGISPYVERVGLDGSQTGGWFAIERSVMRPETPGAPYIRLDVHLRFAYNAAGELVVERAEYNYTCLH